MSLGYSITATLLFSLANLKFSSASSREYLIRQLAGLPRIRTTRIYKRNRWGTVALDLKGTGAEYGNKLTEATTKKKNSGTNRGRKISLRVALTLTIDLLIGRRRKMSQTPDPSVCPLCSGHLPSAHTGRASREKFTRHSKREAALARTWLPNIFFCFLFLNGNRLKFVCWGNGRKKRKRTRRFAGGEGFSRIFSYLLAVCCSEHLEGKAPADVNFNPDVILQVARG